MTLIPVKVVQPDGETFETVLIEGREGEFQNSFAADGRTYFFDKQGFYDGWGEAEPARKP